jgi:RNA polymerase sigma factor (sigma-70 family)
MTLEMLEQRLPDLRKIACSVCWRMGVRLQEDIDDLVQQAIVQALEYRESYRGDAGLGTWFHKIATQVVRAWYRERGPQRVELSLGDAPHEDATSGELLCEELLAQMDAELRALVIARFLEGRSWEELEITLGVPKDTLRKRLGSGLAKFRQEVA